VTAGGIAAWAVLAGVPDGEPPLGVLAAGQRLDTASRRRLRTTPVATSVIDEAAEHLAPAAAVCKTTDSAVLRTVPSTQKRRGCCYAMTEAAKTPFYAALAVWLAGRSHPAWRALSEIV